MPIVSETNVDAIVEEIKEKVKKYGNIYVDIEDEIFTEEDEQAYKKAMEEYKKGEYINLDFSKIDSFEDFLKELKLEDV